MNRARVSVALSFLLVAGCAVAGCDEDEKKAKLLAKAGAAEAAAPSASIAPLVASAAPSASAAPPKKDIICEPGEPKITDPDLEADIRKKLGKAPEKGAITNADLASVKSLNLTTKKSLDELDPCVMPKMTGLKHLYLGPGKLVDLRPIQTLLGLETLRASINEVEDLKPLEKLTMMDALDLGRTHVRKIDVLSNLVNLTDLQLDNTQVTDLAPLAKCKKLEKLSIKHTNVTDVSPLKELTKLKWLYVEGCAISNLDSIQPLVTRGLRVVTKSDGK